MIVINPGTGPVDNSSEEHAEANMKVYGEDIAKQNGVAVTAIHRDKTLDYGEGRFAFRMDIEKGGKKRTLEVQMPGLPIDKVRFLGRPDQDIWHFPRLYLDGSSWVWKFAVNLGDLKEEDLEAIETRCPQKIEIYDHIYECEGLVDHGGECKTTLSDGPGIKDWPSGEPLKSTVAWTPAKVKAL